MYSVYHFGVSVLGRNLKLVVVIRFLGKLKGVNSYITRFNNDSKQSG